MPVPVQQGAAMHKTVKKIIRDAEAQGHQARHTSGHIKLLHKDGVGMVILPVSPGGGRWEENMRAQLRRQGF